MNLFAELLSELWHAIGAQPLLAYALASVVIGLALGAYLRARFSRLTITIISPARGAWVPPVYYVHGRISPQRAPLQVFVHSPATNKWHLQAPVEWEDTVHWRARCCFEGDNAVLAADFKIVAISSRVPIPEPQDELRTNARQSKIINVSRRQARRR